MIYDHVPEVAKSDHFSKYGAFIDNEVKQVQVSPTDINYTHTSFCIQIDIVFAVSSVGI